MGRAPTLWLATLLAVCLALVQASVIETKSGYQRCVSTCNAKENSLFERIHGYHQQDKSYGGQDSTRFEQGKTYRYVVRTSNEANTAFKYSADQSLNQKLIALEAIASVTPISECEMIMRLSQIKLHELKNVMQIAQLESEQQRREFMRQLEAPVVFGYSDGVITELCTDGSLNDDWYALNVKKSILTTLQTAPQLHNIDRIKVVEPDFHGECKTEYKVVKQSSNDYFITKEKDLSKCSENSRTLMQSTSSFLERNLGLNATVRCEQRVQDKTMTEVECISTRTVETYVSHFDIELVSRVQLKLVNVEQKSEQQQQDFSIRRHPHHLMMSAPFAPRYSKHQASTIANGQDKLKTLLARMCQNMQAKDNRVTLDTPEHVQELARLMRHTQPKDVEFVWRNMVSKSIACEQTEQAKRIKDIFVDTAASVMNTNAVTIVRDELLRQIEQQKPVASQRARYLATLVSFAANPEAEAVERFVAELIEKTDDAHIILSLSALVKKVQNQQEQEEQRRSIRQETLEAMFEQILRKVAKQIGEGQREVEILRLLKALKNIVPTTRMTSVQDRLFAIIADKQLAASIRAHALQACESLQLTPKTREMLVNILGDRTESNEVRLTAYRTLINCGSNMEELKSILSIVVREEESNVDIFNYICAHQKNLRSSSLNAKRSLLPLDAPLFPEPKSLTNFLLSRNFEWSFINPQTSIGAVVEADVVMPKSSRVPRYVTFNVTVPVAEQQQQIPMVEVTIRQEGLEQTLAKQIERLQKLVSSPAAFVKQVKNFMQQQQQQQRAERDSSKCQVFINVDGKNVYVWDSNESQREQAEFESIWEQLSKRLPVRIDETAVIVPFQHRVHIPTGAGIPVTFELNTTLIGSLESKINGARASSQGDSFLDILFKPTLVAEFGVGMQANLESVMSRAQTKRVEFVNRFITAPTLHLKTEIKQGGQMRAKLLLPEQEQTIARFETFFTNEEDKEIALMAMESKQLQYLLSKKRSGSLRSLVGDETSEQCSRWMDKTLGVTICKKDFSADDLRQALSARVPRKLVYRSEIRLVKSDRSMEGLEMMVELPQSLKQEEMKFRFHFDTPNSSVKRNIDAELRLRSPNTERQEKIEAQLEVRTPRKHMAGQVLLMNRENEKGIKIELLADGNRRQFLLELGTLATIKSEDNAQLKVQLKLQPSEDIEPISIRGEMLLNKEGNKKRQVQVKFEANEKTVIDWAWLSSGKFLNSADYKVSTHLKIDLFNVKLDSNALLHKDYETGTLKSLVEVKYSRFWAGWSKDLESLELNFQVTGFKAQEEMKKFVRWSFKCSQAPKINHELTYTLEGSFTRQLNQELTIKWSNEQQKKIHIVHQTRALQDPRTRGNVNYDSKCEIEIAPLKLSYTLSLVIEAQPSKYVFDFKVLNKRTSEYALDTRVRYVKIGEQPLALEAQAEVKIANGRYTWQFKDELKEIADGVFQGQAELFMPSQASRMTRNWPKRVQLKYAYKTDDVRLDRHSLKRSIVAIFKAFKEFEHELIIDASEAKQFRQSSLISWDASGKGYVYRGKFEANQTPLYQAEVSCKPSIGHVKVHFESAPLGRFLLDSETIFKGDEKMIQVKVINSRFDHQTTGKWNKNMRAYEFISLTKDSDDQKVIYRFEAKKSGKQAQFQLDSKYLQAELKAEEIFEFVRAFFTERSTRSIEHARADFKLALPHKSIEHRSQFELQSDEKLSWQTETKKNGRNLFRYTIDLVKKGDWSVSFEYLNAYNGKAKITQVGDGRYEMIVDARADKYQWTHHTQANWQMRPYRVHEFTTKNHMQNKNLFDASYRYENEQDMPHQIKLVTRDSHVELACSKLNRDEFKAMIMARTKRFGNIEHKTELKRASFEKKQFVFASKTTKAGEEIVNLELEADLNQAKESWIRIQTIGGRHLKARFVPFRSFDAEFETKTWRHELKAVQQADEKGFQVEMNCQYKTQGKKWTSRVEHRCDQFTRIDLDTFLVRGNIEIKNQERSIQIDLKGDERLRGWEHRSQAQWKPEERSVMIRCNTQREGARFLDFDGELHYGLNRVSTLKIESQPIELSMHLQCDPKVGGQIELRFKNYRQQVEIKRLGSAEKGMIINAEVTKAAKRLVSLSSQFSLTNVEIDFDSELEQLAVTLKLKLNVQQREAHFEFLNKESERLIKWNAQLEDLKNVRFEAAWDAKRDASKQASFELRVQPESEKDRYMVNIVGKILERPLEIKLNCERAALWSGTHSIEVEFTGKNAQRYNARLMHDFDKSTKACKSELQVTKNNHRYIQAKMNVDLKNDQRRQFELSCESDAEHELAAEMLNFNIKAESERLSRKQAKTRAEIVYGSKKNGQQQKTIKYELDVEQKAVRGQIVIDTEEVKGQTIKLEWISPESKLQVNAFNRAGRQLDFNLDIAKPLQKKFQIVSALESIPTVNIELLKGENSRVVIELSFKDEKTAELSFNWFGQWRRDFKLEALIKCYSRPSFELLVTSRHPAGSDLIEAQLKYNQQQYAAMWNRKFEDSKKNWNTQAQFTKAGEKIVDLSIERVQQRHAQKSDSDVIVYKAQLDGRKHAVAQVEIVQSSKKFAPIEYVKVEFGSREQQRAGGVEFYLRHQEAATGAQKTGIRFQAAQHTVFGVVYVDDKNSIANKRSNLVHIELANDIEYILRNEIEYHAGSKQIHTIRSELKRKAQQVEPIYRSLITIREDREQDVKVARVEINSAHFHSKVPKVFEVRYNFQPKVCYELEHEQKVAAYYHSQAQKRSSYEQKTVDDAQCWRLQVLAGEIDAQRGIRFGIEYLKKPIDSHHNNRTVRVLVQSFGDDARHSKQVYLDTVGHISAYSTGLKWIHLDRYNVAKTGMYYLGKQANSMFNVIMRDENQRYPSKNSGFDVKFAPSDIRRTLHLNAEWDTDKLRQWFVGELPALEELSREDVRQARSRFVRNLKAEAMNKIGELKRNFDNELIEPFAQEANMINKSLESSKHELVRAVHQAIRESMNKIDQLWSEIDIEQWVGQMGEEMSHLLRALKHKIVESVTEQCQRSRSCRRAVEKMGDYDLKRLIYKHVVRRFERMQAKLQHQIPAHVRQALRDVAHEVVESLKNTNYDSETQPLVRHTFHLLRMSQPSYTDNLATIAQEATKASPINWDKVSGSMHDIAARMIDGFQAKAMKNNEYHDEQDQDMSLKKKNKSYWTQSPYTASDYDHKKKHNNTYDQQEDDEEKGFNLIFSPKQGQIMAKPSRSDYSYFEQQQRGQQGSNKNYASYWTRA